MDERNVIVLFAHVLKFFAKSFNGVYSATQFDEEKVKYAENLSLTLGLVENEDFQIAIKSFRSLLELMKLDGTAN